MPEKLVCRVAEVKRVIDLHNVSLMRVCAELESSYSTRIVQ
jgi:hypothetical protein